MPRCSLPSLDLWIKGELPAHILVVVCAREMSSQVSPVFRLTPAPEVTPAEVGKDNKENKHGLTGSL